MLIKKQKPKLVDSSLISNLLRRKNPPIQPVIQPPEPNCYEKLRYKIQNNIISFITEYFWVIIILFTLSFILWKRYCWYQNYMKEKKKDNIVIDNNILAIDDVSIDDNVDFIKKPKKNIVKRNNIIKQENKPTYINDPIYNNILIEPSQLVLPADLFEGKNYSSFI